MPRPAFDHIWRHKSYQAPLLSDRMSDLISFRETRKRGKHVLYRISFITVGPGFWFPESRPLEPALGRKLRLKSELVVHICFLLSSSVDSFGTTKNIKTTCLEITRCLSLGADFDKTWGQVFLQASRSFLYSSGTSETTGNPWKHYFLDTGKNTKVNVYHLFKCL